METTNEKQNPKSKFEKEAISLLNQEEDKEKVAKKAYRKAKAKINSQIAQLEGKIVEQEDLVNDAEENVKKQKFSVDFDLQQYDDAVDNLEEEKYSLEELQETLKMRKELLQSWE